MLDLIERIIRTVFPGAGSQPQLIPVRATRKRKLTERRK